MEKLGLFQPKRLALLVTSYISHMVTVLKIYNEAAVSDLLERQNTGNSGVNSLKMILMNFIFRSLAPRYMEITRYSDWWMSKMVEMVQQEIISPWNITCKPIFKIRVFHDNNFFT